VELKGPENIDLNIRSFQSTAEQTHFHTFTLYRTQKVKNIWVQSYSR